jgi:VWFA-related protein
MTLNRFACFLMVALICGALTAPAQQQLPTPSIGSQGIKLDVVVDAKSGQPVPNLGQQDFTVLDNKTPRPIKSFKVMSPAEEPVKVILFVDAVNVPFSMLAYVREGVEKFLKTNEGKLAYPTAIAILTDQGAEIDNSFSTNGIALDSSFEQHGIDLREINRSSTWGDEERLQICMKAYEQLLAFSQTVPGRKIVLWISPGWPLLSGPFMDLSSKQKEQIFDTIVSFSTQTRADDLTLYNINPVGAQESLGRTDYYEAFLKGIGKPNDVEPGNLGLQVLSVQSGGLALESNSDVAGEIAKCLTDVRSWYEITFDPSPGDKPNEYHHIEIRLDQRGLNARTRDGYYANPGFPPAR